MDITVDSLNKPLDKQLQKARQEHINRNLHRLQTKIQMANTISQKECWYEVEPSIHFTRKQTAKAVIVELQNRGFRVRPYVEDNNVILHVTWRK